MIAEYSDWILDDNDNKNRDSSDHRQIVFSALRRKFNLESEGEPDRTPNNNGFCWTNDMFQCQFQVLSVLLEDNDFESADAISFGILTEIEKILRINEGRSTNNIIVLIILKICFPY